MALTSLAEIKAYLDVTDSSQDAWLEALRGGAESVVEGFLGYPLEYAAGIVEYHTGSGHYRQVLRRRPVTAVTAVYLEDRGYYGQPTDYTPFDPATTLLVPGKDYVVEWDSQDSSGNPLSKAGVIRRLNNVWPEKLLTYTINKVTRESAPAPGNLKIVYSAGYQDVPEGVKFAVAHVVAYMRRTMRKGGNVTSERLGAYSYEIAHPRLPTAPELGTARQALLRYRDVSWGYPA